MPLKARWEIKAEKRGEKRGENRRSLTFLLILLKEKFGEIPASAMEKLEQAKPDLLETWGKAVLYKPSLDEVLATQP